MIVSGFKCDVCGREELNEYEEVPAIPDGWATFTMHYGPDLCDREDHIGYMCPGCAKAMHDGVPLVEAWVLNNQPGAIRTGARLWPKYTPAPKEGKE